MLNVDNNFVEYDSVLKQLTHIPANHLVVAYHANMTNYEILLCQKVSLISKIPLMDVLEKMSAFKQTSEHLLYKKDFLFV